MVSPAHSTRSLHPFQWHVQCCGKAEPDEVEGRRTSRSSLYFLAVKARRAKGILSGSIARLDGSEQDAIYTALFGAPEIHPETSWDGVGVAWTS